MILVIDDHIFRADGNKMLYAGWMYFYNPYVNRDETELIELHEGDILRNVAVAMDAHISSVTVLKISGY